MLACPRRLNNVTQWLENFFSFLFHVEQMRFTAVSVRKGDQRSGFDPINFRTNGTEFVVDMFVATINVVNAIDFGYPIGA